MPEKMKIGDKLYGSYTAQEFTVTKVGKKYFEVDDFKGKFLIGTLECKTDYRRFSLSDNKQAVLDKIEYGDKLRSINNYFGWANTEKPTLDQLRKICSVLNLL